MMKNFMVIITLVLILAASSAVFAQTDAELQKIAQPMMENINKAIETKNFDLYLKDCDDGMKKALTKAKFNELCDYSDKQLGKMKSMKFSSVQKKDEYAKVVWKARYDKAAKEMNLELVLKKTSEGWKVAGHWMRF
jgi:type 1 fimbria pilin